MLINLQNNSLASIQIFFVLLWTQDDLGLPTGPLSITPKIFFDNVLFDHVGLPHEPEN